MIQLTNNDTKQALIDVSWAHPEGYAPFYSELEIFGTEGKLRLSDRDFAPMQVVNEGVEVPLYSPLLSTFPSAFEDELSHFIDCAMDDNEPRITPLDA